MAAISDLRNRIDKLQGMVTQIYIATCHPAETLDNSIGIPTLPVISMEDFCVWEDFILQEEKKLIMIRQLIEHCTENLKGSIYCIMRKLMTNKVAVNFNLKGTNREGARYGKKKFQSTTSYILVIAIVKKHAQERIDRGLQFTYNREIADLHITNWLKDAKKRLENELLRLRKSGQQDEQEENETA
ncbi:uncharacterized protein LOC112590339 isoform X2 [Harpegnathos saltator]|uniref:uncharacterized protein LOC112590339 isoform X2 n=1 Tax=Harpegnathos saltator TaxID=610380 RepID=UPI000DBEDDD8|nr:uncharacterized protein LOC112590339 isoform X2 [Harpegnathos saltator]XP_025162276.1 uncharacterized protein LOC112590339 isoform X2 [Harpegnathos saltator]XP_025162278.1 uncharacterized protein LOC112590339 isoform X2 [Harpegnathos saltator]XP_025162279.1 uncharacterized protein LOC112590339 isoform X2 [Harpegnathos saltator]XP_025162283.1 uncharacterized protein LOC112590339 isoform X2 [Harpegnathos saltator]